MRQIQTKFNGGIISPELFGQVGLEKYYNSAETMKNMIAHPHGGASNRAGLEYYKTALGETRLIEFEFGVVQTYILELSTFKLRVIKSSGYVMDGASPLEVTSPYAFDDLALLTYEQSADVMFLCHPSYPPYYLIRNADDDWIFEVAALTPGIDQPLPVATEWSATPTATTIRQIEYRATAIGADGEESLPTAINSVLVETVWPAGATVDVRWNAIRLAADYKWVASASGTDEYYMDLLVAGDPGIDTLPTAVYDDKEGMTYEATLGTLGLGEWGYGDNDSLGSNRIYVRLAAGAVDPDDVSYADGKLQVKRAEDNEYNIYKSPRGQFGWMGNTETPWFLDDYVEPDTSLGYPVNEPIFNTADEYPGAVALYKQRLCYARTNNDPQTIVTSKIALYNNFGVKSPTSADDAFTGTIPARQVNEIRHMVAMDKLVIFTAGSEWIMAVTEAASSLPFSLDVQGYRGAAAGIRPIPIGNTILFVGRDSKHVRDLAYSFQDDSYLGDDVSVYVPHLFQGRKVKEWAWQETPDSILWLVMDDGSALSLTYVKEQKVFAWTEHDTDGYFESVASISTDDEDEVYFVVKRNIEGADVRFVERLHTRVFDNVRECFFVDAGLTWDDPHEITNITTANPCVVTAPSHGLVNGDEVRLSDIVGVEYPAADEDGFTSLNDQWFVVRGATPSTFTLEHLEDGTPIDTALCSAYSSGGYSREGVQYLSGFDHLNGETLSVLADGFVLVNDGSTDVTVTAGAIDLGSKYATIHAGLGYTSDLQTLPMEFAGMETIQGKLKTVKKVTLRMNESRSAWVGPDEDRLTEIKFLGQENFREDIDLFSGDKVVQTAQKWNKKGQTFVRHIAPLPLTVLAIIADVEVGSV